MGAGWPALALRAGTLGALSPSPDAALARPTQPVIDEVLRWLRSCLPEGVGFAARSIPDRASRASVFAAEERLIAGAVRKRRDEFRTGRELAREALAQVGCDRCTSRAGRRVTPDLRIVLHRLGQYTGARTCELMGIRL